MKRAWKHVFVINFKGLNLGNIKKNIDYGHNKILKKQEARMIWPYILLACQNQTAF